MKRREALVVLSSAALSVTGCGGGSGPVDPSPPPPPPSGSLTNVSGTITIPSGASVAPDSLTLKVMGQTATPSAAGAFSLGVSPIAPTLAIAADSNGNGILAGFLDPATGATSITPRTTGVVLCWFAMGGPFLPANTKSQVLSLLSADPRMDALGAVIAQRIAVNARAVVDGDSQIAAALAVVLDALVPPGLQATETPSLASVPQVILTPQVEQSGVRVRTDNVITGIDFANYFRRPVTVYVYEVQTTTNNVVTNIVPARLVAGPLTLGEPTSLTPVGGFLSFLTGTTPFDPFTFGPVALALNGASDTTTFEVVVLGPSANGVIPPFFGAARYATHVAGWNTAITTMFARTYFVDVVYALFLEASGFASLLPTSPSLVTAGTTTQNAVGAPFPPTGGNAGLPPSTVGLRAKFKALEAQVGLINSEIDSYKSTAPSTMDPISAAALTLTSTVDWRASLATGTNFVAKLASPFSGARANGALSRLFNNLAEADRGALWTVKLSKASATITPVSPTVDAGAQVALAVVLSADLTGTYEYRWTQNGTGSTLSAPDAAEAISITSLQKTVNLITVAQQTGQISLQVEVYEIQNFGGRLLTTTATTSVRILQRSTISPNPKALFRGNQQLFTVSVVGTLPAGAKYLWNVTGTAGTIGSIGVVTTTVPTINYTAVNQGDDVLHVQITDAAGLLLSRSSAVINVDPPGFIDFTISGNWDQQKTPANGRYFYGDMQAIRSAAPVPNLDWLSIVFNVAPDTSIGVLLSIFVSPTHVFAAGQTFPKVLAPITPTPGSWQLTLAKDQSDVENSDQFAPAGTGTLTVVSASVRGDGKWVGSFAWTISNGSGTITGTAAAVW